MKIEQERMKEGGFMPPWVKAEHLARFLFAKELVNGKITVDCACGSGVGSKIFGLTAKQVLAFDISSEDIEKAKVEAISNVTFNVADATALPLASGAAEAYVSLETIEHLANDNKFLAEVRRVLQSGGVFVCSTPNRQVTNPGKSLSDKPANKFHIREYNQIEFVELLQKYFNSVELFGQNPQSKAKTKFFEFLAKLLPGNLVVRVSQIFKLGRLVWDGNKNHKVEKVDAKKDYEYLTAVCK